MLTSLKRIVHSSLLNFWRQGGLSFATCFILVMAISLLASLFFFKNLTDYAISSIEDKVDISVYFKNDSSEDDILRVKDEIAQISEVKSVDYISKEEALENFTEKHKDDSVLMDSLTEVGENPLLASLSIKAWQLDQYDKVSEFLSGLQEDSLVEKVDYYQRKPIIERLAVLTANIKILGIIASIFLSLVAILVTFNTIRLTILNQKEEISIQRLVGASNWFIRGPFLAQGTMCGILSALISFSLFALLAWLITPKISFMFSDLNIFRIFLSNIWIIFAIEIVSGVVLGTVSSMLAIRRYLRV
jgi:cell division transport system permease protein